MHRHGSWFNLGIGGADILATVINEAHARGEDFASQAVLAMNAGICHTPILFHGTNSIVKLLPMKPLLLVYYVQQW